MKKVLPLVILSLICSLSVAFINNEKEVNAYSIATLSTSIDLNDCTSSEIASYYSSLSTLSSEERSGQNLLKNLKTILSANQKYYSYDSSGERIWQIYEISDRDWNKSPASEISGYDSSTNKITGYSYGNTSPTIYVHSLYTNRDVDNLATAYGNHDQKEWGINREHIWPKSLGFDTTISGSTGGARGDPMHLWSGNGKINNMHSNYPYGNVDKSITYIDGANYYSYVSNNYLGTSLSKGTGTVFEPQDSDKGDIARSIFYMVARYNNVSGTDTNIDSNNPNLTLTDDIANLKSGSSTADEAYSIGILHDLLEWHKLDPVDEYEIHRNNLLYKNYTNNRNPFIDYPEWVNYIWGEPQDDMTYSETTGYADTSKDVINGYKSSTPDEEDENIDTLNNGNTINASTTSYKEWSYTSSTSNITYSGKSAGSDSTIQLTNNTNTQSGIVITISEKIITKVSVAWNSKTSTTSERAVAIYGSDIAYASPSDIYDETKKGTSLGAISYGTSTELSITREYKYIALSATGGAIYLDKIEITYEEPVIKEVISSITLSNDMSNKTYTDGDEWDLTGIKVNIVSNLSTKEYELATLLANKMMNVTLTPSTATLGTTSLIISNITYSGYDSTIEDMTITGISVEEKTEGVLQIGKEYVISHDDSKSLLTSIAKSSGNYIGIRAVVNKFYTDTYPLTIEEGYTSTTYSFKTKDNTYLAWTSGNTLTTSTSKEAKSSWEVSYTNSAYKVKNASITAEERCLQFNSYSNQERFACYVSSQNPINFTLIDDSFLAGSFIEKYMHPEIESSDTGTGLCISENYYQTAKTNYLALSDNIKNILESEKIYLPYYDRLLAWAKAANDNLTSATDGSNNIKVKDNNKTSIMITITSILISAIGCSIYLFNRRKEEQK